METIALGFSWLMLLIANAMFNGIIIATKTTKIIFNVVEIEENKEHKGILFIIFSYGLMWIAIKLNIKEILIISFMSFLLNIGIFYFYKKN